MSGAGAAGFGQMGGSILNGIIGSNAAQNASDQEVNQEKQGLTNQQQLWQQTAQNFNPYTQNGATASNTLANLSGPHGELGRNFSMADYHADPDQAFNTQQGLNAIGASGSVQGGALSGGTQRAAINYGENQANNGYQSAYQRFTQNQNRLQGLYQGQAGLGLQASTGLGSLANQYSGMQNQQFNDIGTSQAAGTLGAAQAQEGAVTGFTQGLGSLGSKQAS